jgi:hypothetical protein
VIDNLSRVHHLNNDFLQALQEGAGVLSGSALLHACCPSDKWSAGDVDVFHAKLPGDNTHLAHEDPQRNAQSDIGFLEAWAHDHIAEEDLHSESHYDHLDAIIHVHNYTLLPPTSTSLSESIDEPCVNTRVQIITTRDNPVAFVEQHFDMDFLKLTFDGHNVTIHNMSSVRTKRSSYHPMTDDLHTKDTLYRERICKYMDRGFTLDNVSFVQALHSCATERHVYSIRIQQVKVRLQHPQAAAPCTSPQQQQQHAAAAVAELHQIVSTDAVGDSATAQDQLWCTYVHIQDVLNLFGGSTWRQQVNHLISVDALRVFERVNFIPITSLEFCYRFRTDRAMVRNDLNNWFGSLHRFKY